MRAQGAYELGASHAFLELPHFAEEFSTHLKLEGLNPAGSIKLKAARAMVENAEADGVLGFDATRDVAVLVLFVGLAVAVTTRGTR